MTARIIVGDVTESLRTLPDESVQCVVTSPPYWGLRDYGTGTWQGGGGGCDHTEKRGTTRGGPLSTITGGQDLEPHIGQFRDLCGKCGARRIDRQLGLERTPEEYVARMVDVFREVRRVLRSDGTAWVNMGDSYSSTTTSGRNDFETMPRPKGGHRKEAGPRLTRDAGMKPKDLVGIPWRVAFALQADGWWLRSDIIWSKPNPMPESVTDRPTKAHEYLFLLTKSARYYYDADAVREPYVESGGGWQSRQRDGNVLHAANSGIFAAIYDGTTGGVGRGEHGARNLRTVWTIATEPFPEAHFATFPRALVEPCIKAGTSERGACPECGAGWVREVERIPGDSEAVDRPKRTAGMDSRTSTLSLSGNGSREWAERGPKRIDQGWRRGCSCCSPTPIVPCTVLDPFAGSGTAGVVALSLGRNFVGIELNPAYAEMARRRLENVAPLLGETTVSPVEEMQAEMFGA